MSGFRAGLGVTLLPLIAMVLAAPARAADAPTEPVEVTSTQRVALAPGGTVHIDETWGELSIEGWDEPAVEVVTTRRTAKPQPAGKVETARAGLERFGARVEATATDRVSIVGLSPSGSVTRPFGGKSGVKLSYVIHVPRNSRLELDNGIGTVRIGDINGDIAIDSDVGEVTLKVPIEPNTAVEASSGIGEVVVSAALEKQGDLHRRALVGQRFSYRPAQVDKRITVKLGVGSITIG
jgi:hypothetical protein